MPVDVLTRTEIARPVAEVAAFATDPENAPRWYRRITAVDRLTPPPLGVGTRLAFRARFLGRTLAYTYEVTEHIPGERLVMATAEGPFPMETTYTWRAVGADRTEMTLRNRGTPTGAGRLLAPLTSRAVRRANRQDLEALRDLLEGR